MALIWKKGTSDLPSWSKKPARARARIRLPQWKAGDNDGPGLLFFLVALVVVAVAGARFLGFAPELSVETDAPVVEEQRSVAVEAPGAGAGDGAGMGLDREVSGPAAGPLPAASPGASPGRVIIYHAHTSENYRPNPPHARGGRAGDVVKVGAELAEGLRREGLAVEHLTQVFDHPQWGEAFARAGDAVARLLDTYNDVVAVIDVHRDATPADAARAAAAVRVAGEEAARVLFVVGEADNPYAPRNAAFAEALKNRVDAQLPGMSRGVRLHTSNYNGHLHPRSVQLFIGDYEKTTLEQARAAARLLAPLVAAELRGAN